MQFACHCQLAATSVSLLLLLCSAPRGTNATTMSTAPRATSVALPLKTINATCEFRTINYITDSLPQLCLKSSWSNNSSTPSTSAATSGESTMTYAGYPAETVTATNHYIGRGEASVLDAASSDTEQNSSPSSLFSVPLETEVPSDTEVELSHASFLSFEDWKRQTLEKTGQPNSNVGNRKLSTGVENKRKDSDSLHDGLDSLYDEGEINLDFGAFGSGDHEEEPAPASDISDSDCQQDSKDHDLSGQRKDQYRSKDAGKTWKERFSYSSFDAGATVLKTHPGAKNAVAVLIENKDSYMLSECASENKFLIVELSEDIWIDTVVLANYEFFSSMIRTFRVSVSDLYPVKLDRWTDIGTYEARNSREIQAFLIENPRIWARYLRLEFLSHYGNEYYCPLSLLRVHGTRMLESWREIERGGDDEDLEENDVQGADDYILGAVAEVVQEEGKNTELRQGRSAIKVLVETAESDSTGLRAPALNCNQVKDVNCGLEYTSTEQMMTPWIRPTISALFEKLGGGEICLASEAPEKSTPFSALTQTASSEPITSITVSAQSSNKTSQPTASSAAPSSATASASLQPSQAIPITNAANSQESIPITKSVSEFQESAAPTVSVTGRVNNASISYRNKTTSTSTAPTSLPTIQESFFKAVSRRLQLLEANSTLSLMYIEEQSKILREAFTKVERKQLQKTTTFLETLNSTVLEELRGFRQQYDEIWQSTVISLEAQREESQREILAISTRLSILADEVVFQKRMSIVQSVLLLLCLGLVIFSRVSATGHLDFPIIQNRSRNPLGTPIESSPSSPGFRRPETLNGHMPWISAKHKRQRSDESLLTRSRSEDDSTPTTPISSYSRSENEQTPQSGRDEPVNVENQVDNRQGPELTALPGSTLHDEENMLLSSSPMQSTKSEINFRRQTVTPSMDGTHGRGIAEEDVRDLIPVLSSSLPEDCSGRSHEQQVGVTGCSSPSPLSDKVKPGSSISRKPLPLLPVDGG